MTQGNLHHHSFSVFPADLHHKQTDSQTLQVVLQTSGLFRSPEVADVLARLVRIETCSKVDDAGINGTCTSYAHLFAWF